MLTALDHVQLAAPPGAEDPLRPFCVSRDVSANGCLREPDRVTRSSATDAVPHWE